jgi:predicted HD superfamily hydrolase involved in NAD metabolism
VKVWRCGEYCMHDILIQLGAGLPFSGEIARDVPAFLTAHGRPDTVAHCGAVAAEARRVAELADADLDTAEVAGWLHDISVIIPSEQRVVIAEQLGVEVLPEEALFPMIIHQKLSAVLAREIFQIQDDAILSAVGCHTTLKAGATLLDKVLFVADKLAWDQPGHAPFHDDMRAALDHSLDQAALVYLRYLWEQRARLKVLHPWAQAAYIELINS